MSKLISFAVPCYNSAEYMKQSIMSIVNGGEDVEIIIVDDGSKDDTLKIAKELEAEYPTIIKVVHQENGGHGDAVNTGLKNSTGKYFKVVDSDDKLGKNALVEVISFLKRVEEEGKNLDLLICNYVYDKVGEKHKKVMRYKRAMPNDRFFSWSDKIKLKESQYILMHSVIYRTEMLRKCKLELPKHTFYVDNIFVFHPLPYVQNMYYLDVNLYKYYIGREDQSVNEKVMISRLDQQIRVTKIMIDSYLNRPMDTPVRCSKYMAHYLDMMMCVSSILCILSGEDENLKKKEELWNHLKEKDIKLYKKLRHSFLGIGMNLPGKAGRSLSVKGYKVMQKIYKFN